MATIRLEGENVNVVYAHNIFTENRITGLVVSVALTALLAFVGTCMVWPLKDFEFSSIGWWMIGTASLIVAVQMAVFMTLIKQSHPSLPNIRRFSSLERFQEHENAYDFSIFNDNGNSYIMFLIKEGDKKEVRVFIENEISGQYDDNLGKKHHLVLPDQL